MLISMKLKSILARNITALMERHPDLESHAKIAKRCRELGVKLSARAIGYALDKEDPKQPKLDTVQAIADAFKVQAWLLMAPDFDTDTKRARELPAPEIIKLAYRIAGLNQEKRELLMAIFDDPVPDHEIEAAGFVPVVDPPQVARMRSALHQRTPRQMKMKLK